MKDKNQSKRLSQRYWRNLGTVSIAEQLVLMKSSVAVIGCGGMGGHVLEQLLRLGIGRIIAWDPDVFEEHNLNRQLLSEIGNIGTLKVEAAEQRAQAVNPEVKLLGIAARLDRENGPGLLREHQVQVAIDALDSGASRLALSAICRESGIPLVHGAVEGWRGQLATQYPGEMIIETIYNHAGTESDASQAVSTPSFTPALIASLQVAEAVKILIGRGEVTRGRLMLFDILEMEMEFVEMD